MPFLLLLILTISCLPVNWPAPPEWIALVLGGRGFWSGENASHSSNVLGSIVATWGGVVLLIAAARVMSRHICRELSRHPQWRDFLVRRHGAWRFYHFLASLTFYGAALYLFGWGWVAQGAPLDAKAEHSLLPGLEFLIVAPLLVVLISAWICFYDAERSLYETIAVKRGTPFWSRWAYVGFNLRQNVALVFLPVLLLIIVNNLARVIPVESPGPGLESQGWLVDELPARPPAGYEKFAGFMPIGAAMAVFATMPWSIRLLLGLRGMPEGALRNRLLTACRRLHFRCNNILIWNTHGGVANAMVIGILPFLRYIVLTDRLVSDMTPDEVEAVFGHEVGHVKHRHMWCYLGFLLVSLPVLTHILQASGLGLLIDVNSRQDLAILPLVAMLGAYIFLVFGFLSRRCERQADIYGCRTVSCGRKDCCGHDADSVLVPQALGLCPTGIHIFINALEKVAYLNGISRDRPGLLQSWQHSTIARRVDFLHRVLADPSVEARFQRAIAAVKWTLILGLGCVLIVFCLTTGWAEVLGF